MVEAYGGATESGNLQWHANVATPYMAGTNINDSIRCC